MHKRLEHYTHTQFLDLITCILEHRTQDNEEHLAWITQFAYASQHPKATDLLYYPEPGADRSAEGILEDVLAWRHVEDLPGFQGCLAIPGAIKRAECLSECSEADLRVFVSQILYASPTQAAKRAAWLRRLKALSGHANPAELFEHHWPERKPRVAQILVALRKTQQA
ncbi:bacteriocin immunity protein [Pseudomonas sp. KNUC1026]|uniref:bacteriocin immunity protein n=1 Tax=Pseudomonas sp. KNUC1026 TaxID=2893890 RepID=UPI001F3B3022|nr:bacteriocin immunity protein [Pseudomonas sp. KNUC1026]UFH48833.1 bacteriocin immunity protein [Pseudomonas sp. KNUC1026]